jgi:hypothetical protein
MQVEKWSNMQRAAAIIISGEGEKKICYRCTVFFTLVECLSSNPRNTGTGIQHPVFPPPSPQGMSTAAFVFFLNLWMTLPSRRPPRAGVQVTQRASPPAALLAATRVCL